MVVRPPLTPPGVEASFRLSDAIPEELWNSKSAALQDELRQVRTEMERHEVASQVYETAGPRF